ncbi:hypothetical protein B7463_g1351, partial [Scytalidium lignicola]
MSTKKVFVVFGATGTQGGSVINTFLSNNALLEQFTLRGITRDPLKPAAVALADKAVIVVKADMDDKASLREALKDAYAVFAVTNWQEYMDVNREIQHGKNIADICKEANVQHLIWSSLPYVSKISNGKLTKVIHFDSKGFIQEYIQSLGIPSTILYLGVFTTFILSLIQPVAAGSKSLKISIPIPSTAALPLLSANKDVGKYVASILQNRERFLGKEIYAADRDYSFDEIIKILRDDGGLDISFEQCSEEDYREGMAAMEFPEFLQEDMIQNGQFITEFGYFRKEKVEAGHEILTEPLQTFQEWVRKSELIASLK